MIRAWLLKLWYQLLISELEQAVLASRVMHTLWIDMIVLTADCIKGPRCGGGQPADGGRALGQQVQDTANGASCS